MALDDKHPKYLERLPQWKIVGDCYAGEEKIKAEGATYLPPTSSMRARGWGKKLDSSGQKAYDAYILRALFHEFFRDAVVGMLGSIHRKPPSFKVPPGLDDFVKKASSKGESLELFWRRITEAQLVPGRCGVLVEVPTGSKPGADPFLAFYAAETIINWDVGQREQGEEMLELVVLDESDFRRKADLSWGFVRQYRVLTRSAEAATIGETDQAPQAAGTYVVKVFVEDEKGNLETDPSKADYVAPSLAGVTLEQIPFVFFNVNDVAADPDIPPLIGLARLCLAIYRGEADYRQTLFMQGQATVVRIGATKDQQKIEVGAGAVLDVDVGGDAKYIGAPSEGISEQRQALDNDKREASSFTIQFLATEGGDAASGTALRIRVSARTTTLATVQNAVAMGMRDALIHAGRFKGIPEEQLQDIEVTPNLEFSEDGAEPTSVSVIMDGIVKGAPLSRESFHAWLKKKGFTTMEFEQEMEAILGEAADMPLPTAGVDPNAPQPPPAPGETPPEPPPAPPPAPKKGKAQPPSPAPRAGRRAPPRRGG